MQLDQKLDFDLENSPLYLKTHSEFGNGDIVHVNFFTTGEKLAGKLFLHFSSPPQYQLSGCSLSRTNFPTTLTSDIEKEWKIRLTRTSGVQLGIYCNGKEALNIEVSSITCSDPSWSTIWTNEIAKIEFSSSWDTATDFYKSGNLGTRTIIYQSVTHLLSMRRFLTLACTSHQ